MYRRSTIIQTFAIKLIQYQLSCNHIHLLSSLICYSASTAIDTFAIKPCTCYRANLLLILSCNQQFYYKIFDFPSILFLPFFCPKNLQKIDKNSQHLEFFILWQTLCGHGTGSFCCLK